MIEQGRSRSQWGIPNPSHHPADFLVLLLLVVAFFLAPLKLLGTSWFSYLGADGLALLVLFVVFGERLAGRKPLLAASPLSVPLILLAAFCLLELANPEAPFLRSVIGIRSWLLYLAFYFVGLYTFRSVAQIERLYALLLALGFLATAYGIYQWRAGPASFANWSESYGRYAQLTWSARGGVVFRAFSIFVNPGAFGGNMVLLMFLAFGVAASSNVGIRWRIAGAITFIAMGAGIAVSGSRGPVVYLMLAAAVALALVPGARPRIATLLKALGMAGLAAVFAVFLIGTVIGERFATIFDPQAFLWKWFGPLSYGIGIAQEHPFGMGLGYTAGVPQFINNPAFQGLPTRNVDSGYGSAAAELGLVGLVVFTYFALKVGIEGVRTWKRMPPGRLRDLLLGPALIAATYPIVSLIGQPQATLPSSIYCWLLIGMLMKAPEIQRALDADQLLRSQVHAGE
jgi:putative inorganic carbon (HCO3(-)) transporter